MNNKPFPIISADNQILDCANLKATSFKESALISGYIHGRVYGQCLKFYRSTAGLNLFSSFFDSKEAQEMQDIFDHGYQQGKEKGPFKKGEMIDITFHLNGNEMNVCLSRDDIAIGDKFISLSPLTIFTVQNEQNPRFFIETCKRINGKRDPELVALIDDNTSDIRVNGYLPERVFRVI